jgi:DNA-binding transcriptional LysR family regulator
VLAQTAQHHPHLHIHTSCSDRFVDLIAEGFDCGIRVRDLQDTNLIAKRVGPIYGTLVASPDDTKAHGSPETVEQLVDHQAVMQGTEAWQFMDGDKMHCHRHPSTRPFWISREPDSLRQLRA